VQLRRYGLLALILLTAIGTLIAWLSR